MASLFWIHVVDKRTHEVLHETKFVASNAVAVMMRIGRESGLTEEKLEECHILVLNLGGIPSSKRKIIRPHEVFRTFVNSIDYDNGDNDDDEDEDD